MREYTRGAFQTQGRRRRTLVLKSPIIVLVGLCHLCPGFLNIILNIFLNICLLFQNISHYLYRKLQPLNPCGLSWQINMNNANIEWTISTRFDNSWSCQRHHICFQALACLCLEECRIFFPFFIWIFQSMTLTYNRCRSLESLIWQSMFTFIRSFHFSNLPFYNIFLTFHVSNVG